MHRDQAAVQPFELAQRRAFDRQAAEMPIFVEYQHKTSRQIPVLVLTRLD